MMLDDEIERIDRAKKGDAKAFSELIERHQAMILRVMRRFSRNLDDAQDLTQDAFVLAFQRIDTLRDPDLFEAWLRTLAYNVARQWNRRRNLVQWRSLEEEGEYLVIEEIPASSPSVDPLVAEVRDAFLRLPAELRAVVSLHYFAGYDYDEIGKRLNVSEGTVRGRLHQARRRLREEMLAMMSLDARVEAMERKPFVDDPKARALYEKMNQKIFDAGSFAYESEFRCWMKENTLCASTCRAKLKKPGYALMETYQEGKPKGVVVGDGTAFWVYWPGGRPRYSYEAIDQERYDRTRMTSYMKMERPASRFSLWHALGEAGSGGVFQPSAFFGYFGGLYNYMDGVRRVTEEAFEGEECDVIEVSFLDHQRSKYYWISRSDGLPRQFYEVVRAYELIFGHEIWRNVILNPELTDDLFVWSPPEGWEEHRHPALEEGLLKPGTEAPDFRFSSLDGSFIRLSDFRGKVVWLNIWRVGCPDAREEAIALERLHREFGEKGLVILGFDALDDSEIVARFFKENDITYPNIVDTSEAAGRVALHDVYQSLPGTVAVPLNYIIDRDGRIVEGWYDFEEEKGRKLLAGLGIA